MPGASGDRLRVVVTGMGLRSPIGNTPAEFTRSLMEGKSGIRRMEEWEKIDHMRTRVGGVCDIEGQDGHVPRVARRSLGRVGLLAVLAAMDAVDDSGLGQGIIASSACGVSFGSTAGSTSEQVLQMGKMVGNSSLMGVPASAYLRVMSHTCAGNLATFFHCQGPFIASCTACAAGSQGVGFGYEAIRRGQAQVMITGGADELHFIHAAIFDLMLATSAGFNDRPQDTPRPFDAGRDGLVVAEGAGCLVLEEYGHARSRGANIYGEIMGYATNSSGRHLTDSDAPSMEACMRAALKDAGISSETIEHVNAHATATANGDQAEALATHRVFGDKTPVTALKGHTGHTLGASGAIETMATLLMARGGFVAPTLNLDKPDPDLAPLNHVQKEPRPLKFRIGANNNFAFGGVNTSLIIGLV